ncbi:hypothetical protein Sme01_51690 [Sphaerisporangium melleum]|uniref:Uncharacterized protein n=1 Tax=Sphaerisporangium melleum TaxID=321316 RepID=A0A917QYH7_9ACTN|nr:DUF6084 family protein [Sphaerisporangium melleum]GGK75953.1 hypothetical protein GCM10007964_18450 [Sphaerisporangium melleum]GII72693.1 hypothetical protein Sme01_51690 [Sphaerisporangium melleum]
MSEIGFECRGVRADPYGAFPTLLFRLAITAPEQDAVHAIALRCQIRIEPQRRRYAPAESELLADLFGDPSRWGETLRPLVFANVSTLVPRFTGGTEIDLPVPCGYDLEVAAGKYFAALDDGEVPLLLLFSGTVFARDGEGFTVRQVPWDREARQGLPVEVWREMLDRYFPGGGWLRLGTGTLRALQRFKSERALPTWDEAMEALLKEARG